MLGSEHAEAYRRTLIKTICLGMVEAYINVVLTSTVSGHATIARQIPATDRIAPKDYSAAALNFDNARVESDGFPAAYRRRLPAVNRRMPKTIHQAVVRINCGASSGVAAQRMIHDS